MPVSFMTFSRRCGPFLLLLPILLGACAAASREKGASPLFVHSRTEVLVAPILEARRAAAERRAGPRADGPDLSGPLLEDLFRDDSEAADEAEAVLLGYHLGEAKNRRLRHDLTLRGSRVLPYLRAYRDRTVVLPGMGRLDSMRFPDDERRELFETVIETVERGDLIGTE